MAQYEFPRIAGLELRQPAVGPIREADLDRSILSRLNEVDEGRIFEAAPPEISLLGRRRVEDAKAGAAGIEFGVSPFKVETVSL